MDHEELFVPENVLEEGSAAKYQMLPEKSKLRYQKELEKLTQWQTEKGINGIDENVMMAYFKDVGPASAWLWYSVLKSTLFVYKNVDISRNYDLYSTEKFKFNMKLQESLLTSVESIEHLKVSTKQESNVDSDLLTDELIINDEFDETDDDNVKDRFSINEEFDVSVTVPGEKLKDSINNIYVTTKEIEQTDERPHKCDVCGKSFRLKTTLNQHKVIHFGEKQFQCEICNKAFLRKGDLTNHLFTHKGKQTVERPHKCDVCGKSFRLKNQFNQHKVVHFGEKQFQCEICNKAFLRKSDLANHLFTHKEDKLYQCEVCKRCFKAQRYVSWHKKIHNKKTAVVGRPGECDISLSNLETAVIERPGDCDISLSNLETAVVERPGECDITLSNLETAVAEGPRECDISLSNIKKHKKTHNNVVLGAMYTSPNTYTLGQLVFLENK